MVYLTLELPLVLIRSNKYTTASTALNRLVISLFFCLAASFVTAEPYALSNNGDDTILIEKEVSNKIPYSRLAKAVVKHFFKMDVQKMFTGGKNRKTASVRNFSEYADRTKYRVGVKRDTVELKFSLNF